MSSRVTTAITSRRAKQKLVQVLFGKAYSRGGPEAHRLLDHSIYSYGELRRAYLNRLQLIHPDKFAHKKNENENDAITECDANLVGEVDSNISPSPSDDVPPTDSEQRKKQFVELQEAWFDYEQVAKQMKQVQKGDEVDANFTMFGVGCSFADSPDERDLRADITDQACRGWFVSGVLSERTASSVTEEAAEKVAFSDASETMIRLSDVDMFVEEEKSEDDRPTTSIPAAEKGDGAGAAPRNKSLVDHLIPRGHRRRRKD